MSARGDDNETPARVLVVDDLEVNRDLLARRVRKLGHEVELAVDGRDALAKVREQGFDLVLLDITMPEMDGYEVLSAMKSDEALARIPVVMITAIDSVESVVRCIELGADDYLTKPFNPVVLRARITSSLNNKRVTDLRVQLLEALSREMEIAQRIQLGFLPEALPVLPGWDVAASCVPAKHVSGDFFDALILADGKLYFAVADVCDKGVGAALYMALIRTLLRATASQPVAGESAAETLLRAVRTTGDYVATVHGRENMFATVFAAIVDPGTGRVDYINAGHDAPVVTRAGAADAQRLTMTGPAVGMMPGASYETRAVDLARGDSMLVFTDGLTEGMGESGAFGEQRVIDATLRATGSAADLLAGLGQSLAQHVGEHPAHDDVTIFCLRAADSVPG